MDLGLAGKLALVCGGSRGIGRAVALELASEGAHIALCGREPNSIALAHEAIAEINGDGALGMVADLSIPDDIDALVREVTAGFGRSPDVVVWNAGGPPTGPILELPQSALDESVALHLAGALHLFRSTVPSMVTRGFGRVIAITSVAVRQPLVGLGLSNAVRAGLHGVLKTLAEEVGASGVTVNAVLPGFTQTDRLTGLVEQRARATGQSPAMVLEGMARQVPAARIGTPAECAAAVAFLASARASYINGVSLQVDGGFCRGLL